MPDPGESSDSLSESLGQAPRSSARDPLRLLESLPVPIFVTQDQRLIFVNEAQSRLLAAAHPADVIGTPVDRFLTEESRERFLSALDDLARNPGTSKSLTETFARLDGRSLTIEYIVKSISYDGRIAIEGVLRKVILPDAALAQREESGAAVSAREIEARVEEALTGERAAAANALRQALERERSQAEERLQIALAEERRRAAKSAEEAAAEARRTVQRQTNEAVERERAVAREAIDQEHRVAQETIAREKSHAQEAIAREKAAQEATARERANTQEAIERERAASKAALAEAQATHEQALASAISAERAAAKKHLKEAIAVERSTAEAAVRDAGRVAAERARSEAAAAARSTAEQELRGNINTQRSEAARALNEELARARAESERGLAEAIANERAVAERAVAEAVAAERSKFEKELAAAVAAERERAEKALQEAAVAERQRIDAIVAAALEEHKAQAAKEIEKASSEALTRATESAGATERVAAQKALGTALEAERAKFEAATRQLAEDARAATVRTVQEAIAKERASAAIATREAVAQARESWQREQAAKPASAPPNALAEVLFNSMAEGVYGLDLEGRFTQINRAAAEMLEYEPAKLIGRSAHEVLHSKRRDGSPYPLLECALHSGVRLGHMTRGDNEVFWTRRGSPFPVEYAYAPLHEGTNVAGGVVTFTDITERKLIGQEVAQSDRMSSLGRFAAAATHEFDKVLQGIRSAAEVIRWLNEGDEYEEAKTQLVRMLERGSQLTRQISRFTEPPVTDAKPIEVMEWFQSFVHAARVGLKDNIELNFRLPDETLYVKADPSQLNQIFMNLVLNARDAMPDGGRVTLSIDGCLSGTTYSFGVIETPDQFVHFVVEDTGVGIPQELMSKIFEPLFTTKGAGAAGMGLAICHQLVRKLGGSIFVESTGGSGTQFHIFLPAAHPELDAPAETPAAATQPSAASPRREKRIVVISTEKLTEEARSASEAGVEIEVVIGGQEAVAAVEREAADAVVMDISWMELDGVELYREMATRWPKLPIIISTAKIHEVKIKGGVPSLPSVRYLPYDVPTLLKWVEGRKT